MENKNKIKLKEDHLIHHNINDKKMKEWALHHLHKDKFHYKWDQGFYCQCGIRNSENEETENDLLETGSFWILPEEDDENWEAWMGEITEQGIVIYYCPECEEWAMDEV